MKSSIHLLYGIIIGILLFASTGSLKEDKAEFKDVQIQYISQDIFKANSRIKELVKHGWTIIDYDVEQLNHLEENHYVLIGK